MHVSSLIMALHLCACSGQASPVVLTERDCGQTVQVVVGDIVEVRLEENPTTGYSWEMVGEEGDQVALLNRTYQPASHLIGSGGWCTFQFRMARPGQVQLRLRYVRPWETSVEPLHLFTVNCHINARERPGAL